MATSKLTTWWTAFIGVLVALLASLGFASEASAAASVPQRAAAHNRSEIPTARTPIAPWALPGLSALPPTMKQRIRAEAHGSSPSTRHLPAAHEDSESGNGADGSEADDSTDAAAPGATALSP